MKVKNIILYICVLSLIICTMMCGCKKNEETTAADTIGYQNPPSYDTEGTPEEDSDDIILGDGEEGGDITPPSLTAPQ